VSGSSTRQTQPTPKRIRIIAEDTYAVDFLDGIIKRLKSAGKIPSEIEVEEIRSTKGAGKIFSGKISDLIKVWEDETDKILIFVDADGKPVDKIREKLEILLKRNIKYPEKVKEIIFEQEIEEWITLTTQDKPSDELKRREKYEKYMLPDYVDRVDFDDPRLMNLRSFKEFLGALNDP